MIRRGGRLLADERPEQVHARLLVDHLLGAFLPRQAECALRGVRQDLTPLVEHGLHLRAVPRLLARHQPDVEVVAVDAHVQDVERAHRGPAVLVRERDRRDAVALHLLGERDELVPGLRNRVALLLEDALPVEDRPRVVVDRDEVVVPVQALRRRLHGRREVRLERRPHVVDRGQQPLLGEELHAVPGEPGEHVLWPALQVAVDLLLERVVVDRVDLDLGPGGLRERGEDGRGGLLRDRVGRVRAERHGACRLGHERRRHAPEGSTGTEAVEARRTGCARNEELAAGQGRVVGARRGIRH